VMNNGIGFNVGRVVVKEVLLLHLTL